jgi:hypothetical protein
VRVWGFGGARVHRLFIRIHELADRDRTIREVAGSAWLTADDETGIMCSLT